MKRIITLIVLVGVILLGSMIGSIIGAGFGKTNEIATQPVATTLPTSNIEVLGVTESYGSPVKLIIPKIGVNAEVEPVGLDAQNRMDVPQKAEDVGWYELGFRPGEKGSSVLAGHYDTVTGAPAVFYSLNKLEPGDTVSVLDDAGKERVFEVTNKTSYSDSSFPIDEVFAANDTKRLNLITCGGVWDKQTKNYSNRTVVYTKLIE